MCLCQKQEIFNRYTDADLFFPTFVFIFDSLNINLCLLNPLFQLPAWNF